MYFGLEEIIGVEQEDDRPEEIIGVEQEDTGSEEIIGVEREDAGPENVNWGKAKGCRSETDLEMGEGE